MRNLKKDPEGAVEDLEALEVSMEDLEVSIKDLEVSSEDLEEGRRHTLVRAAVERVAVDGNHHVPCRHLPGRDPVSDTPLEGRDPGKIHRFTGVTGCHSISSGESGPLRAVHLSRHK